MDNEYKTLKIKSGYYWHKKTNRQIHTQNNIYKHCKIGHTRDHTQIYTNSKLS